MQESGMSPLGRLVLVIVCLALAGSMVAGIHYLAIDLPSQDARKAPLNSANTHVLCATQFHACSGVCYPQPDQYERVKCYNACKDSFNACIDNLPVNNP